MSKNPNCSLAQYLATILTILVIITNWHHSAKALAFNNLENSFSSSHPSSSSSSSDFLSTLDFHDAIGNALASSGSGSSPFHDAIGNVLASSGSSSTQFHDAIGNVLNSGGSSSSSSSLLDDIFGSSSSSSSSSSFPGVGGSNRRYDAVGHSMLQPSNVGHSSVQSNGVGHSMSLPSDSGVGHPSTLLSAMTSNKRNRQFLSDKTSNEVTTSSEENLNHLPEHHQLPLNDMHSSSSSSYSSSSSSSSSHGRRVPGPFHAPIVHLIEENDSRLDPSTTHLENPDALLQILGSENFIADFMAVRDPSTGPDSVDLILKPNRWESSQFESDVNLLLAEDQKLLASKVGQKIKKRLSNLLFDYTQCPVLYSWKDMGSRFWPRFIREGSCMTEKSCSFPAGMTCKPAEQSHLTLLRFYCGTRRWGRAEPIQQHLQQQSKEQLQANCRWITIQYPIITKCSCGC